MQTSERAGKDAQGLANSGCNTSLDAEMPADWSVPREYNGPM